MADSKVTALTATTAPQPKWLIHIVEDPAGTPVSKKVSKEDLGASQPVKITADLTTSTSTTLGDAAGLLFAVESGNYYRFSFQILYRSAATTTGIKLSLTIPSVTTFSAVVSAPVSTAADGTAGIYRGHITASADAVVGTGTPSTTETFIAEITGTILPSANGNVQVQFASEVAASTVTVKQGSNGLLWKL